MDRFICFTLISWFLVTLSGFAALIHYSNQPGTTGENTPLLWIDQTDLPPWSSDHNRLLVFMHPKCSCSEATLSELERLIPLLVGHTQVFILFYLPKQSQTKWKEASLYIRARALKQVTVIDDYEGKITDQFSAVTSGMALIYSKSKRLIYRGGLTASRAHEGPSVGNIHIEKWARTILTERNEMGLFETQSFGCEIKKFTGLVFR